MKNTTRRRRPVPFARFLEHLESRILLDAGLSGTYFNTSDLSGPAVATRTDAQINFNWDSAAPLPSLSQKTFSARWTGAVTPLYSETYTFSTQSDDGVRLWVNGQLLVDNWTTHSLTTNSGTITLTAGQQYSITMEYFQNNNSARAALLWSSKSQLQQVIPAAQLSTLAPAATPAVGTGLLGTYFNNKDFTGASVAHIDQAINFTWGQAAPDPAIDPHTFSVRWTGKLVAPATDTYTLALSSTDGVRLYVNGKALVNAWYDQGGSTNFPSIQLTAGQAVDITLEYYNNTNPAQVKLEWSRPNTTRQVIPTVYLFPPSTIPTPPPAPTPTVPTAPANLISTNTTATSAALTWTDAATNETNYLVQRAPGTTTNFTTIATLPPNTTSYSDSALSPATTYTYRILATNAVGNSLPSNTLALTTPFQQTDFGTGLRGTYFDNANFTGASLSRIDSTVNFDWGNGSPDPSLGVDTFSARWKGQLLPTATGTFTFYTTSDDGVRLTVNGQLIINNWTDHPPATDVATINLVAGQKVDILLEYYENGGGAVSRLDWAGPGFGRQTIPASALFPAAPDVLPTVPLAPSGLTAAIDTSPNLQVRLNWLDNATNETGYFVQRAAAGSTAFTTIATLNAGTTSFTDATVGAGTGYLYQILAANAVGNSAPSPAATVSTPAPPAPTPNSTHPDAQRIGDFQWTPPAGLVTPIAPRRGNIFYQGETVRFTGIGPAAKTYEIRDYNGTLVDSGNITSGTLTSAVAALGWFKLYLYGTTTSPVYGDVVGGTTFVLFRNDPNFAPAPATSNMYGDFITPVLTRVDPTVDFTWGRGSPAANINVDKFGIIWTGQVVPKFNETYTFYITADDQARLYVNGQKIIDYWNTASPGVDNPGTITLQAGQRYDIRFEMAEVLYDAGARLQWSSASQPKQIIPSTQLYPTQQAPTPGGLTGNYYNLFKDNDSAMDTVLRSVVALGPQRYAVTDTSNPAAAIAQIKDAIALDAQLNTNRDPARPRPILVAFPNGTTDLANVKTIVTALKDLVQYWEARNEPNFTTSGAGWIPEIQAFYTTVKSVSPTLKVVGPSVVTAGPYGLAWMDDFFKNGGGNYVDAVGFHAYNNVNGDVALIRQSLDALKTLLAKYGQQNKEIWQTEQGFMATQYGAYTPRLEGQWTMLEQMVFEQYGIPKEHNHYWYDRESGFAAFPMQWINHDNSMNPTGALMRVWSEELFGTTFSRAFDFGPQSNTLYVGSLFTGANKSVAAFISSGDTQGSVTLNVSGSTLRVVDAFGNASTLAVTNGTVTLPVREVQTYVELAPGQTLAVVPADWGANLARLPGTAATASGTGQFPGHPEYNNAISKITNGQLESWYWAQGPNDHPWTDDTAGPTSWVQLAFASAQTVSRVNLYAGIPWQSDSSLLDFDVQYRDATGNWVTLKTVVEPTNTVAQYTPATNTTADSFYSGRSVFQTTFAPVTTTAIRILVRSTTYGGAADLKIKEAGALAGPQHLELREIEVYSR